MSFWEFAFLDKIVDFCLGYTFDGTYLLMTFSYNPFYSSEVGGDVLYFIPNFNKLRLLSVFLVVLAKRFTSSVGAHSLPKEPSFDFVDFSLFFLSFVTTVVYYFLFF